MKIFISRRDKKCDKIEHWRHLSVTLNRRKILCSFDTLSYQLEPSNE